MTTLDEALADLDSVTAVEVLVRTWRAAGTQWLAEEIIDRCYSGSQSHDWDLDRFNVLTLTPVLDWLISAGPTSGSLGAVLDRVTPYLPDPRATKPLTALAEKKTGEENKINELLAFNVVKPSDLSRDEVLKLVLERKNAFGQRAKRLEELVAETDAGRRMVLADWFVDQGDPLGEFVGLQLQRANDAAPSPREAALWTAHGLKWISQFLGEAVSARYWSGNGEQIRERVRFEQGVPRVVRLDSIPRKAGIGWRHVRELKCPSPGRRFPFEDLDAQVEGAAQVLAQTTELESLTADLELVLQCKSKRLRSICVHATETRMPWSLAFQPLRQFPAIELAEFEGRRPDDAKGLLEELDRLGARTLVLTLHLNDAVLRLRRPNGSATFNFDGQGEFPRMKKDASWWVSFLGPLTAKLGKLTLESGQVNAALRPFVK